MLLLILATVSLAAAMPSFIAVPSEQIAFVDLSSIHLRPARVPRQTLTPPPPPPNLPQALYNQDYQPIPIPIQQYPQQNIILKPTQQDQAQLLQVQQPDSSQLEQQRSSPRYNERPPDFGEYVDFGAHTGDNGAFGWYADYPLTNREHSDYRK